MQNEVEDNKEDYHCLAHEYWCELMSKIKAKDNSKRAATQINNIASSRAASHYNSNVSVRVPHKNKARTGVLRNKPGKKVPKHQGIQHQCVLCKQAGMPERKYMLHSGK